MDFREKWEIVNEIGEGGQGKVFRVVDKSRFGIDSLSGKAIHSLRELSRGPLTNDKIKLQFENYKNVIIDIQKTDNPTNSFALKKLHDPKDARNPKSAEDRINDEMRAMSNISHPNLLKVIDFDIANKWFVSEYHFKGSLSNNNLVTGNFIQALTAFRPLVHGVAHLHNNGYVHRDIKPQNVFINSNNELVLGDFGLISFTDEEHTRISEEWENVGSRDWMPGWAMGMKIDDVKPTFDVFSLGKLLWAMVSDTPILRLWYYDDEQFNLENKFPEVPYIEFANKIFNKCIVEKEINCLKDANELLKEIDQVLNIINKNADLIHPNHDRYCKVCGMGIYKLVAEKDRDKIAYYGFNPTMGNDSYKVFICNNCGNVQLFFLKENQDPKAWIKI